MSSPIRTDAPADEGTTRRHFIRGVASAGASTVAASTLLAAPGVADLLGDSGSALAAGPPSPFSAFNAIAASSADAFEVPAGYRAHVVIRYGDTFANSDGTALTFGYNNDFLAFFPLDGKTDEGLLFVNHEYPAPFLQHGVRSGADKNAAQIALEQESVGNSVLHVRKDGQGLWQVVSPSPYNRRITGNTPVCEVTGPLVSNPRVGATSNGSIANCSGGITPWGTALSCEENFQDYGARGYGWSGPVGLAAAPENEHYDITRWSKYGWVVETDPYDPSFTPRKHTALGRFRHENTAFRAVDGKPFVLYMGDDKVDAGVYKFVSDLPFIPGRRSHNLRILESGKLYIAWFDESRRRFANNGDTEPITKTSGTGWWREVTVAELEDCQEAILASVGRDEFLAHHATNRPEDLEVDTDGTVYIAFTNNANVFDQHGAIRKLVEAGNDPTAVGPGSPFSWSDYAGGGERADRPAGERGFSSCDNLCFDSHGNLWVVTDISSSSLAGSSSEKEWYRYHGNNAVFMIPRSGPNAGVAFRFANMPIESEGTGPYFTPNEDTLFVNVQHPGEESAARGVYGDVSTYTSWWPEGNKTIGHNPSTPLPSLVAVTRLPEPPRPDDPRPPHVVPPVPLPPRPGQPRPEDVRRPRIRATDVPRRRRQAQLIRSGLPMELTVDEPVSATVALTMTVTTLIRGRGRGRGRRRRKEVVLGRATRDLRAGRNELTLKLSTAGKLRVRALRGKDKTAELEIVARDEAGNRSVVRRNVKLV